MKAPLPKHGTRAFSLVMLLLSCFTYTGVSGENPAKVARAIQEVDGYRVRVVRLGGGSYGYEIRKGGDVLICQKRNPFTGSQLGLTNKEDAMKTATWLVQTVLKKEENLPQGKRASAMLVSRRLIPKTVARELSIAIDK